MILTRKFNLVVHVSVWKLNERSENVSKSGDPSYNAMTQAWPTYASIERRFMQDHNQILNIIRKTNIHIF